MFCHDCKPRCVAVKAVAASENKRHILLSEIERKGIGQGIVTISVGRMDGHAGRLVHNYYILIFIYDIDREVKRLKFAFIICIYRYMDCQYLSAVEQFIEITSLFIYGDTSIFLLKLDNILP